MTAAGGVRQALIIGAGFGGIGMAIRLKRAGIDDFVILERADGVGGVWHANRYPGAACDVESHLYSYSFETNFDWERPHGTRREILRYFDHCLRKYAILPHIRFNTPVETATFDEEQSIWNVRTRNGETLRARSLISACGLFNTPAIPKLAGIEGFAGEVFHSAAWNEDFVSHGRRIAVIGTGCSTAQFVPEIVGDAARLVVFQRTPAFVGPKAEAAYSARQRRLYRLLPILRRLDRLSIFRRYEQLYRIHEDPAFRAERGRDTRAFVERQVSNPQKRQKLTPTYDAGCKRGVRSGSFLKALDRDHVDVVTEPIERVHAHAIETRDGALHPVDTIIYGTGFTPSNYLSTFELRGLGGLTLSEAWKDGPEAYLGITMNGFPNFFMIYGPNTNAPASIIYIIECQIDYILKCVQALAKGQLRQMHVDAQTQATFNADLQAQLRSTAWASGCMSYFMTAAGKIVTQWPGASRSYWMRTRRLKMKDYQTTR
ncbi:MULTISPECIES: NAD(P)/FAD-dependent oxidoreductase [unclassified Beijerinckia]|uniref:flavin-containing monooxygenase n=1 Tax=unclassified Beijerinckia TaxID=2638183 RepID=UPI00089D9E6A|nr:MULTISPECIES: NAD(P)/FAD-dependent oxidoreductase [unclassified Beijerinckia]MDH7796352.1 cation diffusion facilitator CzcD-associated flavoprotein CzcO [Beijerinckia sp. GAS462]SEC41364.1 Predicted flavoprotein CzcO associated with the cation diffusion facilitator CzcD [Beijerinckia sp. 28-YEA-48]